MRNVTFQGKELRICAAPSTFLVYDRAFPGRDFLADAADVISSRLQGKPLFFTELKLFWALIQTSERGHFLDFEAWLDSLDEIDMNADTGVWVLVSEEIDMVIFRGGEHGDEKDQQKANKQSS